MDIVIDNNILFSLMNPLSANSYIFSMLEAKFFAPEFVKREFEKYEDLCLFKSGLSKDEFAMRREEIEGRIIFFDLIKYSNFLKKTKELLADPDDVDFLALALALNAVLWSNDSHMKKQSFVKVFTTSELVDKLLRGEFL